MMQRAKSITGPCTERRQLSHVRREFNDSNQGGIVQTEKGDCGGGVAFPSGGSEACERALPAAVDTHKGEPGLRGFRVY